MLAKETIEALLKIDTQNKKDNRVLRIMSCNNPVKDFFVYELSNVYSEFNENPKEFEKQLTLCIMKFNKELSLYLAGKPNNLTLKDSTILLTEELIKNAIYEMENLYALLYKVASENDFSTQTLYDILHFKLSNYTAILQLCGLVDISDDVYRSKLLSRLLNIKEQVSNFKDGRMMQFALACEFSEHLKYLSSQINLVKENNMYGEDFLVYVIMFDIRHYKHNRKNKMLVKN